MCPSRMSKSKLWQGSHGAIASSIQQTDSRGDLIMKPRETTGISRRSLLAMAGGSAGAALLTRPLFADDKIDSAEVPAMNPGTNTSFGPLKQIDAGLLNVGYAEAGPENGPAVILLH